MADSSLTSEQLLEYVKGPDFPTGGIVINKDELKDIYTSGQGKIKLRGKVVFEKGKGQCKRPACHYRNTLYDDRRQYRKFLNDIYTLVETKKTNDIVDISNQSSKEGIRIVLELRKNADVGKS